MLQGFFFIKLVLIEQVNVLSNLRLFYPIEEKMNSDNQNEEEYKIRKTYYALPDAPEYTYCA